VSRAGALGLALVVAACAGGIAPAADTPHADAFYSAVLLAGCREQ